MLVLLAVAAQAGVVPFLYGYGSFGGYNGYNNVYGFNGNTNPAFYLFSYQAPAAVMPFATASVAQPLETSFTPVPPAVTSTQYHSKDELGRASFGYAYPGQAASNYRDASGHQIGSYAYYNPEGKHVQVSYVADSNGFRVLSNDLPVVPTAELPMPVVETEEVARARAAHLAAVEDAKNGILPLDMPQPVEDTEEVSAAKVQHALAIAAVKAAANGLDEGSVAYYDDFSSSVEPNQDDNENIQRMNDTASVLSYMTTDVPVIT